MKLEIKEWDETTPAYEAAFTEETAVRHYRFVHAFDNPAEFWFIIADKDGTKARKYATKSGDIYIGVAQVNFEDPTDTAMFKGRIMKATPNTQ